MQCNVCVKVGPIQVGPDINNAHFFLHERRQDMQGMRYVVSIGSRLGSIAQG
jgi:hypothetical protein